MKKLLFLFSISFLLSSYVTIGNSANYQKKHYLTHQKNVDQDVNENSADENNSYHHPEDESPPSEQNDEQSASPGSDHEEYD